MGQRCFDELIVLGETSPNCAGTVSRLCSVQGLVSEKRLCLVGAVVLAGLTMTQRWFRCLVVASAALFVFWTLMSWFGPAATPDIARALSWNGYGGVIPVGQPLLTWGHFALRCAAMVGLFFCMPWGRWLFWLSILIPLATSPFMGLGVYRPADAFLGLVLALADGGLAVLVLSQPVRSFFSEQRPAHMQS